MDVLLKKKWNSTLDLYTESDFHAHEGACERCRQLHQTFAAWIQQHLKPKPAIVPPAAWEFVQKDPGLSSRWVLFSWVSVVPWYVKLLLQVLGMAAVVLIVISVPYMGDLISSSVWDSLPRFSWRSASKATLEEEEVRESLEQEPLAIVSGATVAVSQVVSSPDAASSSLKKTAESSKPTLSSAASASVSKAIQNMSPKTFFQWTATGKGAGGKADQVLTLMRKYTVQKAGSLDLGAQYRGGRYFHFSLPEGDYDKLLAEVQALGFQHFRQRRSEGIKVRPQGQARIVLLIRELD